MPVKQEAKPTEEQLSSDPALANGASESQATNFPNAVLENDPSYAEVCFNPKGFS